MPSGRSFDVRRRVTTWDLLEFGGQKTARGNNRRPAPEPMASAGRKKVHRGGFAVGTD